ncbi:hypothetical protein A8F94_12315 [Bacillus sp. FJAT-27225]|uniref:anti-sigma factor domain-containing protein n=1 Tax=Bacillus sp. FJAT-27225 TaxID=1743144 RepID=UPI00080C2BC4|nr:anti-sigma factor domain-containing protein [Bacillus sp. FJAT-27225]OCA85655.1 hypothetical protein A8F94_12315 [Bacillus sp. FJAT-27225]
MRTGIILEMDESFLTLLTPEGEFLKARRQKRVYTIGEEISFDEQMLGIRKKGIVLKKLTSIRRGMAVAAAAVLLLASTAITISNDNRVYAYMSIDVNPSIELGINDDMEVIKLNSYNAEGKKIASKLKGWEKEDAAKVAKEILVEIKRHGYFAKSNEVVISSVNTDEKKVRVEKKLEDTIKEISKEARQDNHKVKLLKATEEDLKKARKLGQTTGKYKTESESAKQPGVKTGNSPKHATPAVPGTIPSKETKAIPPGQVQRTETPGQENKTVPPGQEKRNVSPGQENKTVPPGQEKKAEKAKMEHPGKNNQHSNNGKPKANEEKKNNGKANQNGNKGKENKNKKTNKGNQNGNSNKGKSGN